MNPFTKTLTIIEHHSLELRYASLRLQKQSMLNQLMSSIESQGQHVPVVVVPSTANQWVLMDGYLRVNALKRLGKDTVHAEIWSCQLAEALLMLLAEHQSRAWEAVEEALVLRELHTQHGLSQQALASQLGRDHSWVSRRLSLLEVLPESSLQAVTQGKLSLWSATRILAPVARATPLHAELLLQYLLKNSRSTRELRGFYDHYQQSSKAQRTRMVNDPDLFFKARQVIAMEKQAHLLQGGLEGKWISQLGLIRKTLTALIPLVSQVLNPAQDLHEYRSLLEAWKGVKIQFDQLTETVRRLTDADPRCTTDNYQPTPKG